MKKIAIKYGVLAGLINSALMLISFPLWKNEMDFSKGEILGYTSMLIALSLIFFGIKKYRDDHLGGKINFMQALKAGIFITLLASMIYTTGWMIFSNTLFTDFETKYMEYMEAKIYASDESLEMQTLKLEKLKENMELYSNPLIQFVVTFFIEVFPVGLIISLISAMILKKK